MAELLQDAPLAVVAALALLLVPEAALPPELSLAQPARPALVASMAITAIAATVICLIPALLIRACKIKRNHYPERTGACPAAPDEPRRT
jgi:hypothetical protein